MCYKLPNLCFHKTKNKQTSNKQQTNGNQEIKNNKTNQKKKQNKTTNTDGHCEYIGTAGI